MVRQPHNRQSRMPASFEEKERIYEQHGRAGSGRKNRTYRRKQKTANSILIITIVLAVCVFGVAGFQIIRIMGSYQAADHVYADIEQIFTGDTEFEDPDFHWDYDQLLQLCADAVGYIYQPRVMSYPVVQAEDNDKYLRTLMNGEYNVAGTIFVDARFPECLDGKYSIIYGHNMDNDTMFGTIPHYLEESYYQEHPYFDLYIGYKHYRYYVFSAFVVDVDGFVYNYELQEGMYKPFFDRLRAECAYETNVRELTEEDHVVVLSTCVDWHDYNYRNIVCLVRGEEIS